MLIKALQEVGGVACLREVVRRVAIMENGSPPSKKLKKSVYTGILQNHLPKLRLAGIVEYNRETDTLRLVELPKLYRYHLEAVEKGDLPWCLYYLALSIGGILSGVVFGVFTGLNPGSLLTMVLSSVMFVSAILHTALTNNVNGIEIIPMRIKAIIKRIRKRENDKEV